LLIVVCAFAHLTLFFYLTFEKASEQGDKDGINERGSLNSDGIYFGPLDLDGIEYS
jgi:hypothetical protein